MKSSSVLFLVFSLFLVGNFSNARKVMEQGEYWRNMMNGQPMPKAIKDLLVHDQDHSQQVLSNNDAEKKVHFTRDFDIKTNVILYHTHHTDESKKQKQNPSKLMDSQGKAIVHG